MSHDPSHPHYREVGKDGQPHGHHVMSALALLGILLVLMAFTAFTVYSAKEWHLGILGNASLAIFIATIKATLVCMFFMHLKYDNHFYTVAMLACVCLVILFLFFSMTDLGSRNWVEPERAKLLVPVPLDKVGAARYHDPLLAQGRTVYVANCARCHGAIGTGVAHVAPPLVQKAEHGDEYVSMPTIKAAGDAELATLIRDGRAATDPKNHSGYAKPAKAGNPGLTDEQIMAAVRFVRAMGEAGHGHAAPLPHAPAPTGGEPHEATPASAEKPAAAH